MVDVDSYFISFSPTSLYQLRISPYQHLLFQPFQLETLFHHRIYLYRIIPTCNNWKSINAPIQHHQSQHQRATHNQQQFFQPITMTSTSITAFYLAKQLLYNHTYQQISHLFKSCQNCSSQHHTGLID